MTEKETSYTVRNYDAVDNQIAEIAAREKVRTESLRQENLRALAITATIFAGAAAIIIVAIGIAIWLANKEKITIKTAEVPTKIVDLPVHNGQVPHNNNQTLISRKGSVGSDINSSEGIARLENRVSDSEVRSSTQGENDLSNSSQRGSSFSFAQLENRVSNPEVRSSTKGENDLSSNRQESSSFTFSEGTESKRKMLSRKRADLGKTYNSGARIILTWEGHHDLDLLVKEPTGYKISYASKKSTSGGYLDIDENVRSTNTTITPIETVGWEQSELKAGEYQISVGLYRIDPRSPAGNIPFTVSVVNDGRVDEIRSQISRARVTKEVSRVSLL